MFPPSFEVHLAALRRVLAHKIVRFTLFLWAVVCAYDTALSQLIPESVGNRFPKVRDAVAMTSGWLPLSTWLLILAAILLIATLQLAVRRGKIAESPTPSPLADGKTRDLAGIANAILERAGSYNFKFPLSPTDPFFRHHDELKNSTHPIWTNHEINQLRRDFLQHCYILGSREEINYTDSELQEMRRELHASGEQLIDSLTNAAVKRQPEPPTDHPMGMLDHIVNGLHSLSEIRKIQRNLTREAKQLAKTMVRYTWLLTHITSPRAQIKKNLWRDSPKNYPIIPLRYMKLL
jgi:hypothetical protein